MSEVRFKFGYHDLLDNDTGYEPFVRFDFAEVGVEYNHKLKDWDLSRIGFVNITSLHPISFHDPRFSWMIGVNHGFAEELAKQGLTKWTGHAAGGVTFDLSPDRIRFYFMTGVISEYSVNYWHEWHLGPMVESSLMANFFQNYKIRLRGRLVSDALMKVMKDYYLETSLDQSLWVSDNHEYRLEGGYVTKFGSFDQNLYRLKLSMNFTY